VLASIQDAEDPPGQLSVGFACNPFLIAGGKALFYLPLSYSEIMVQFFQSYEANDSQENYPIWAWKISVSGKMNPE